MATISLTKVAPLKKAEPATIKINNCEITIQKLTTNEQGELIERILSVSFDNTGMYSPFRFEKTFDVYYINSATNISFTDKQMEDIGKLYDLLEINGILNEIHKVKEYVEIKDICKKCADNVQNYNGSFVGAMKMAGQDYNLTADKIDELMKKLSDPDKVGLVTEVLEKMG